MSRYILPLNETSRPPSTGKITNPTGAAVPSAEVLATGVGIKGVSSSTGSEAIPLLLTGRYRDEVRPQLELGNVSEKITVEAGATDVNGRRALSLVEPSAATVCVNYRGEARPYFPLAGGGPVRKNKTHFFAGVEETRKVTGSDDIVTVPTAQQRTGRLTRMRAIIALLLAFVPAAAAARRPEAWLVDSLVKVFPEDTPATAPRVDPLFDCARRAYTSIQIAVRGGETLSGISAEATPMRGPGAPLPTGQVRWVRYVKVDSNSTGTPPEELVHKAPGLFPDALEDVAPITLEKDETRSLWITVAVPAEQRPGEYKGEVRLLQGDKPIVRTPYRLKVYAATVPKPIPLAITNYLNLSEGLFQRHFGISRDSPEWWDAIHNIARFLAEHHQNGIFQNTPGLVAARLEGGGIQYDFARFDRFFDAFLSGGVDANIQGGNLMARERRKDAPLMVDAWIHDNGQAVLRRIPQSDPRAQRFLESYLPALYAHLVAKGWEKKYLQGVMDEPGQSETGAFAEVASMVRKYMPGVRIIEPMSLRLDLDFLKRNIDVWVTHLGTIESKQEILQEQARAGRELWYYTALSPRGRYPNRLIDFSLLKVRILHWLNFKYDFSGYLHWGANYWSADPYQNTQPVINQGRTLLPPGDAFITYPNRAGKTFNSSIRMEQMREGIEDYGLLSELRKRDAAEAARICGEAMQSLTEFVRDPARFRAIRRELLVALSR